jgi:two-component system, cell cycle sensor histidine kinase and response regulator CckA
MQPHLPPVAHVLVADDEPAVRRFASRVLLSAGFAVHEAADGREALSLITDGPADIDVVVSDVVMPELNGVELMQRLAITHPHIPVLLMSAYTPEDLQGRGIDPPCGMLPKPFAANDLVNLVHHCLGRSFRQGA